MVFSSSMPRRRTISRHISSRYGISAAIVGTVGCTSQSIGRTCISAWRLQQQIIALHFKFENVQIDFRRRAERLAGAHIEARRVQWALDAPVLEPTIGKLCVLMCADIVGGAKLSPRQVKKR